MSKQEEDADVTMEAPLGAGQIVVAEDVANVRESMTHLQTDRVDEVQQGHQDHEEEVVMAAGGMTEEIEENNM